MFRTISVLCMLMNVTNYVGAMNEAKQQSYNSNGTIQISPERQQQLDTLRQQLIDQNFFKKIPPKADDIQSPADQNDNTFTYPISNSTVDLTAEISLKPFLCCCVFNCIFAMTGLSYFINKKDSHDS